MLRYKNEWLNFVNTTTRLSLCKLFNVFFAVNKIKKLLIVFVAVLVSLIACDQKEDRQPSKRPQVKQLDFFKLDYELKPYKVGEFIHFHITNLDTVNTIDSIQILSANHLFRTLRNTKEAVPTNKLLLGQNSYDFKVYFSDKSTQKKTRTIEVWAKNIPKKLNYEVVGTYKHRRDAYTQGLQYHDGFLYEGTGRFGKSVIRKVQILGGEVLQEKSVPAHQFGEGITIVGDKLYQLTWKSFSGSVYDLNTLEKKQTFYYPEHVEGWGLTYNGKHLIMSDGTDRLFFWDEPVVSSHHFVTVGDDKKTYQNINELEYVDGFVYANIYLKNTILKIDPKTGVVVATVDLTGLLPEHDRLTLEDPHGEVLNGIAYNPETETFYLTGKDWPKLFEVKIF